MHRISRITKYKIYLLLLLSSIVTFIIIGLNINALIISLFPICLILLLLIYFHQSNKRKVRLYHKIYDTWAFHDALILGAKIYKKNLVLQLQIPENDKYYISKLVLDNTNESEIRDYKKDASITICINPKDKHDVFTPGHRMDEVKIDWGTIMVVFFCIGPIIFPLTVEILTKPKLEYQSTIYVENSEGKGTIWELQYHSPTTLYLTIYDPESGRKIKTIKDKKPKDQFLDDIFLSRQDSDVAIVGLGRTPVFDIYNSASFQKVSGIEDFEKNHELLNEGIARLSSKVQNPKFLNENFIWILTNNGNSYHYNIQKDSIFISEKAAENYVYKVDSALMSKSLHTFALSYERVYEDRKQYLYYFEVPDAKSINELFNFAGRDDFELELFNKKSHYGNKFTKCSELLKGETFYKARIIYFDLDIVLVLHSKSLKYEDDIYISGFDKSGNQIFELVQDNFPNFKDVIKNTGIVHAERNKNILIILFNQYGAIAIDLNTGKQLWKFEP